jgi:hypothetical protein
MMTSIKRNHLSNQQATLREFSNFPDSFVPQGHHGIHPCRTPSPEPTRDGGHHQDQQQGCGEADALRGCDAVKHALDDRVKVRAAGTPATTVTRLSNAIWTPSSVVGRVTESASIP